MNLRNSKTVAERRNLLEKDQNISLAHIGNYTFDESVASTRHCENMIGAVQVPVGVAGPLKILNHSKEYYVPLATTEGALIASISRGCKAITQSGGSAVQSHRVGTSRGPVFHVANMQKSEELNIFLTAHLGELQKRAQKTSHHLTLTHIFSRGVGTYRYVRFVFDTQDAMGMNMVTIATQQLVTYIEQETQARCMSLAGNYDVDKKVSWLNMIEGRGIQVWAEVTLPAEILKATLKTTAANFYETWMAKCMMGSMLAGAIGNNAHMANAIAAIFLATGQDMAHVGEAACGITTVEKINNNQDIYISIHLPDLMVGTVGGGTGLATQQEALSLLGVAGGNEGKNVLRFAEIIGATVLAGEISLLASLSEGSLVHAHEQLARGKK